MFSARVGRYRQPAGFNVPSGDWTRSMSSRSEDAFQISCVAAIGLGRW